MQENKKNIMVTVRLRGFTLTIEQVANLASEFYGKVAQLAGVDDECEVIFISSEESLDNSRAFIDALNHFKKV